MTDEKKNEPKQKWFVVHDAGGQVDAYPNKKELLAALQAADVNVHDHIFHGGQYDVAKTTIAGELVKLDLVKRK